MSGFQQIAQKKAAAAARNRQFYWCRRPNGFSDLPTWRVVAAKCELPLYQVVAFVNRLEELANNAANFGCVRGSLERFNANEFAVALGMAPDEAARIYAALESPDIGWISFDHVADFHDRNPDQEESAEAVRQRKRRQRSRDRCRRHLAQLEREGKVSPADRLAIEISLKGISDEDLVALQNRLARAELSTCHAGHVVTSRDIVTVTADETSSLDHTLKTAVDNSEHGARGEAASLPEGVSGDGADAWLNDECVRIVTERMMVPVHLAKTLVARWGRDIDAAALADIILQASATTLKTAKFHVLVTEQIDRLKREREGGRQLGLMPPRPQPVKRSSHG